MMTPIAALLLCQAADCATAYAQEASIQEAETAGRGQATADASALGPEDGEIVVTAPRRRGEVVTPYKPLLRLDRRAIRALGARTLDRLLERVQAATRGPGGSASIVLLNGRRIAGQEEIASLPPEAIEQMDILPEPVAAQFGYPPTARIINIVTARRFTSLAADLSAGMPPGGSGKETKFDVAGTLLRGDLRFLSSIGWRGRPGIVAERSPTDHAMAAEGGSIETLLPSERALKFSASLAGPVGKDLNASLAVDLENSGRTQERSVAAGDYPGPPDTGKDLVSAALRSGTSSFGTTAMVQGFWGDWTWSGTLKFQATSSGQRADRSAIPSLRGSSSEGRIAALATGPIALLPGGPAFATLTIEAGRQSARSDGVDGLVDDRFHRRTVNGSLSLSLPLTSPEEMALNVNASAEWGAVSGQRRLGGWTAGLSATPLSGVYVSASHARRMTAPSLAQISAPVTILPATRWFDRVTGRDVLVDRIAGGNPALRAEQRRTTDIGIELQPFAERQLRFAATYSIASTTGPIVSPDASDPLLEVAFPMLFRRDAAGTLLSVSSLPVNLQSSRQRSLNLSLSYAGDLRGEEAGAAAIESGSPGTPLFALATIDAIIRMRDTLGLAPGVPPLDLLDGAAFDGIGGRPRFELTAMASLGTGNVGGDLNARWRSSTRQRSDAPASDLAFSDLLTVGIGVHAGLEALGSSPWLRALRLELSADNLFDARQQVRDRDGRTPVALRPERLDPTGRTLRISLRKLF